jgi:hypothetical protein
VLPKTALLILVSLVVLGAPVPAWGQLGVVNPFALPPRSPAAPFGQAPHPLNNAHPTQPWSLWGQVVREHVVGARLVVVPMAVLHGGTWPAIERQAVMLPAYRVTETPHGYVVHAHWGVEPVGHAYAWAWRPAYYVPK